MFIGLLIYSIAAYNPSCSSSSYCSELEDGKEIEITTANNAESRYCSCSDGKAVTVKITAPSVSKELFCQSYDITKVTLDNAVSSIGDGAFYDCINLKTINFPADLASINEGAFEFSGITLNALTFTGTNIGPDAFRYCHGLTGTLNLHPATDSQLSIGSSAFESTGISALSITGEVTSIGGDAFKDCTSLTGTVNIPGTVTSFGVAFQNTKITGITLGNGISSIPTDAFKGISSLTGAVSFPNSVGSIGESAFEGTSITSIAFGDNPSLTIIYDKAFYGTPLNANGFNQIQLPSRLSSIGASAFENSLFSGTITVGNSLTTINKNAFCNVSGLTCFSTNTRDGNVFPNTIKTIDDYAFDDTGLTGAISFGTATLAKIGKYAFEGLTITGSLKIELQDSTSVIDEHAFLNSGINEEIEISDGIIEDYAFEGLTFNTLTISDVAIDGKAFIKCTISQGMSFSRATINSDAFIKGKYTGTSDVLFYGSAVNTYAFNTFQMSTCTIKITDTALAERAFESMIGTPRLVFDHDDEEYEDREFPIGKRAFYGTGITGDANHNLVIPESVNPINEYAFALCKGLTGDLVINSTIISDYAFYYSGFAGLLRLNPNVEHLTTFENQEEKDGNAHTFEGCRFNSLWLNNTGSIPQRAFYLMDSIKGQLYFPETIVSIGDEAFLGLTGVTRLDFEKNPNINLVLSIGCFAKCSGISNNLEFDRKINTGDELIPNYAFYKCTRLPSITFHKELKRIGEYSFYECTSLRSLDLPLELTIIGTYAFYGCSGLKGDLLIPPLITGQYVQINGNYELSLGSHVFDGCGFDRNLDASHLLTIPSYAFRQCKFINSLNIPAATSIGSYAFYGCEGFTELHLYEEISSTNSIYNHAFHGCSQLKTMTGFERVTTLSEGAFYGCSELTGSLNFHPNLGSISNYIFYDCKALDGTITWPTSSIDEIGSYSFYGCSSLTGDLNLPEDVETVGEYAFSGCSKLTGPLIFHSIQYIKKYAFDGCSGLSGTLRIPSTFIEIERYAFNKCSGFSDLLHIDASNSVEAGENPDGTPIMAANQPTIRHHAFNDCSGFKGGSLSIFIENEEEQYDISTYQLSPYYRYKYFLRIENDAFEGTKFKNVYYNGRFDPDCDYDIGISQIKGIHTSSNYANKTFCGNPIHKSKLSGGAIAGIVIACVVVVAIIVALIVFFILRNKKNKDQSEGEVEMNGDP